MCFDRKHLLMSLHCHRVVVVVCPRQTDSLWFTLRHLVCYYRRYLVLAAMDENILFSYLGQTNSLNRRRPWQRRRSVLTCSCRVLVVLLLVIGVVKHKLPVRSLSATQTCRQHINLYLSLQSITNCRKAVMLTAIFVFEQQKKSSCTKQKDNFCTNSTKGLQLLKCSFNFISYFICTLSL